MEIGATAAAAFGTISIEKVMKSAQEAIEEQVKEVVKDAFTAYRFKERLKGHLQLAVEEVAEKIMVLLARAIRAKSDEIVAHIIPQIEPAVQLAGDQMFKQALDNAIRNMVLQSIKGVDPLTLKSLGIEDP